MADVDVVVLAGVFAAFVDEVEVPAVETTRESVHFGVLQNFEEYGISLDRVFHGRRAELVVGR